ncbi:MAG: hypothetical protein ACLFVP_05700 [Candidatus Bathyarchaeia archaeon]
MRAKILDRAERGRLYRHLADRYGLSIELDLGFLQFRNYVRVISRDITMIALHGMRITNLGLLFGEWIENNLSLSIEGSQLVGPHADRNVVELDETQFVTWLRGGVLKLDAAEQGLEDGFVIIRHGYDYAGCGELSDGTIWSALPAHRRID